MAYSIHHALETERIERVIVSTDDDEISQFATELGADVVVRPNDISGDSASSESALLHALKYLERSEGYKPDLVVFLQATSPLRNADDISRAVQTLVDEDADSLVSVSEIEGFVWRKDSTGYRSLSYDFKNRQIRQQRPVDVLENGSFYICKPWVLHEHENRLGGRITVHKMNPLCSYQIDTLEDVELIDKIIEVERTFDLVRLRHTLEADAVDLVVLDFDGVLTDNRVLVSETGVESVWCSRADGWGIARLRKAGQEVIVLSTERNPVVLARCAKLGIECVQGSDDKLASLKEISERKSVELARIAYVGNDLNDLECLEKVGFAIAVRDAHPRILDVASFVTQAPGGFGAVREVCDLLLSE